MQSDLLFGHSILYWVLFVSLFVIAWTFIVWGITGVNAAFDVWKARKEGEAELAQSRNEQLVQVTEAEGRLKAASLHKASEIIEAEAVSKSVEIIGKALHDNAGYLQWQWIHMMKETKNTTIYVPTECGLPVLEAGARIVKEESAKIQSRINDQSNEE